MELSSSLALQFPSLVGLVKLVGTFNRSSPSFTSNIDIKRVIENFESPNSLIIKLYII
jgi:hypothetical protein